MAEADDGLTCKACGAHYGVVGGIPQMLAGAAATSMAEEIAVQDGVAAEHEAKRYQTPYAQRYHEWWTDLMLSGIPADGRILDNGCGVGLLGKKLPPERLVGLDISSGMLRQAASHYDHLILGNSQALPFEDSSFDAVVCRSLIHHLPDPALAIKEMHRVLREGGQIVMSDTNTSVLSWLPRRLTYRGDNFSDAHENMSRRRLEKLLRPYFTVTKARYFGYIAYPLLGFPDMLNVFRFVPFKRAAASALMFVDNVLSHLPLLRTQSWGILIRCTRR